MAEKYVKASECEKYFYKHLDDNNMIGAMNAIDEMPAADVEPVRHGKWIYNPNGMDFNLGAWECSACAQRNNNLPCSRNISPYICVGSKYCPNCGARMCGEIK